MPIQFPSLFQKVDVHFRGASDVESTHKSGIMLKYLYGSILFSKIVLTHRMIGLENPQ